jgi:hypothetical protein
MWHNTCTIRKVPLLLLLQLLLLLPADYEHHAST